MSTKRKKSDIPEESEKRLKTIPKKIRKKRPPGLLQRLRAETRLKITQSKLILKAEKGNLRKLQSELRQLTHRKRDDSRRQTQAISKRMSKVGTELM